ncbi:MAG: DUF6476 family protein [Alphaproteobacteria bacterium]
MNKLKAIKIVVAILTFFLVFGVLCAIGIIVKKVKKPTNTAESLETFLNQPMGSTISSITHNQDYTYILIKNGGLEDRIVVLDSNNNNVAKIFLNEGEK